MVYIYVLRLQDYKYYVGKTFNPNFRLETHFTNGGSSWTKKYKPIEIIELNPNCDEFDEDKLTLKYMKIYGIDHVRGGSFCSITLSDENYKTIKQMISGSSDHCYTCDEKGHFANECKKYDKETFYVISGSGDHDKPGHCKQNTVLAKLVADYLLPEDDTFLYRSIVCLGLGQFNLRKYPSLNSQMIGKISHNEIIDVYDIVDENRISKKELINNPKLWAGLWVKTCHKGKQGFATLVFNGKNMFRHVIASDNTTVSDSDLTEGEKTGIKVIGGLAAGAACLLFAAPIGALFAAPGLFGAAAVSSGLAFLGGGSIISGGLGMAGGTAVIGAVGTAAGVGVTAGIVEIADAVKRNKDL